jgi:gliding motility-associated-like protein
MKNTIIFLSIILVGVEYAYSQRASFVVRDTCTTRVVDITNTSIGASTYKWHFCSGSLNDISSIENLGADANLKAPAFVCIADDDGSLYTFITNHINSTIIRNSFGNSLMNSPTTENLGSFNGIIPERVQGIQIVKDNFDWYGFVTGGLGGNEKLIRLHFGSSLSGTPTATDFGNVGELSYPIDLTICNDNNNWFGFTVNFVSHTITRFDFGNSLANTPTGTNLGNIGELLQPSGVFPYLENGNWYLFISNLNSRTLTKLEFGNSLSNTPTGTNMGYSEILHSPFGLSIIEDCGEIFGYVANRYSNYLHKIDFGESITNSPVFTDSIENSHHPHGISKIYRDADALIAFITNIDDSTISRMYYPSCTSSSILTSEERDPPDLRYEEEGIYNISLIINEGMPSEDQFCKKITILETPELDLGNDTTICPETEITIFGGDGFISYVWHDGSEEPNFIADTTMLVELEVEAENECIDRDTLQITMREDSVTINDGIDTILLVPGGQIELSTTEIYNSYNWSNGSNSSTINVYSAGTYFIAVVDENDCVLMDTVEIKAVEFKIRNFLTPNDDGVNDVWNIPNIDKFPAAIISIYDRFGKLIVTYPAADTDAKWDGKYNGIPLPSDTYWYVINLNDNANRTMTGHVTIKR